MPGTILVSVIELLGLPFPSTRSLSIKVSMGNKEFQTMDKGEFSFPLTTLRETLVIIVHDAEGNEISRGGVETKSIVERGLWDDIFPLEGGGQIRMKLQFVLNQDEKNRIRMMRESAMKRKQSGSRTSSAEFVSSIYRENTDKNEESTSSSDMASPQGVDTEPSKDLPKASVSKVETRSLSTEIPSKVVQSKQSPTSVGSLEIETSKKKRPSVERFPSSVKESVSKVDRSLSTEIPSKAVQSKQSLTSGGSSELETSKKKRPSIERSPSSVKRMITAFENSLTQDNMPQMNPTLEKPLVNKIELDSKETSSEITLEETTTKVSERETAQDTKLELLTKELGEEKNKPLEEDSPTIESPSVTKQDSDGGLVLEESREDISSRSSQSSAIRIASADNKLAPMDYHEDKESEAGISSRSSQSSGIRRTSSSHKFDRIDSDEDVNDWLWIFSGQQRLFCVTTGGKKVMEFMASLDVKSDIHQNSSDDDVSGDEMKHVEVKTPKPESKDVECCFLGLFGKVMKVAIMVGFGVLVLSTRQRSRR